MVKALEKEVATLAGNVGKIKAMQKEDAAHKQEAERTKSSLRGKDRAMMDKMDEWSERMNQKTKVGTMSVMSKLKNAIHLIKKGALSGNDEARTHLDDVLKHMSQMAR